MKTCSRCHTTTDDFRPNQAYCRPCQNEYNREWFQKNRERALQWRRDGHDRRKYGLKTGERQALAEAQNHRCAACGTQPRRLVVDHDHETGRVRGLLCDDCNISLGHLRDDLGRVLRLAAYLNNWY